MPPVEVVSLAVSPVEEAGLAGTPEDDHVAVPGVGLSVPLAGEQAGVAARPGDPRPSQD